MRPTTGDAERLLAAYFAVGDDDPCGEGATILRFVTGEMDPGEQESFERHLAGCSFCRADLAAFEDAEAAWDSAAPGRVGLLAGRLSWPRVLAAAAAAVVAAVLLTLAVSQFTGGEDRPGRLRVKGSWELQAAAERDGRTFRLADGMALRTGDRLGFFYTAESPGYLMILYAAESGEITRLYPALGNSSTPAKAGAKVRIPDGAVLSPGTGCEWIVGMFSSEPVAFARAQQAVRTMVTGRKGCRLRPESAGLGQVDIQVIGVRR